MSDFQNDAIRAVKQTANIPNFAYRGDLPIGETWAFTISRHRDSGLLDTSNWEVITGDMEKRFPEDCSVVGCSHWAVGWLDHFAVKMLDADGNVTEAGIAILEWQGCLESYPVASDEDYSARELEATIANIESELSSLARHDAIDLDNLPAITFGGSAIETASDLAGAVFSWLWDNDQGAVENRDDQGGYPSEDQIRGALEGLGYRLADTCYCAEPGSCAICAPSETSDD